MSPYQVLGITPGASCDEVRRAWRRRALETHPDRGGDASSFDAALRAFLRLSAGTRATTGPAPILVRRMDATALVVRWYRRRRDRNVRPRVV